MHYGLNKTENKAFMKCVNGVVVEINTALMELTGYSENELTGKSIQEVSRLLKLCSQIDFGQIKNECRCYLFDKKCEPRAVAISCVQTECKISLYTFKALNDINESLVCKWLMEEKCKEMDAIIENISERLYMADRDHNVKLLKQLKESEFNGIHTEGNIKDILINKQYFNVEGNLLEYDKFPAVRVLNGEKLKNEKYTVRKDGGVYNYSISGSPIYDEKGEIEKAIISVSDITEIIKSQQAIALEHQHGLLNNMVENLCLGCIKISYPEFKINYVNNEAFNYISGINHNIDSVDRVLQQTPFQVFGYNQDEIYNFKKNIKILIENREGNFIQTKKVMINGREKFMKIIYQPLFDLNYKVKELVSFSVDVTDEIQAKNKIEKALKTQDDIFANVAHELKTPLNVIFSANQLMEYYLNNASMENNLDKISKSISIVKQNCYRFTKLINNIVDLSKMDSGFFKLNLTNENIVQLVENIVQSVTEYVARKGINIIFDTNTEECITAVDSDKIERIILNLISNAIKFTNSGGSIIITVLNKVDTVEISVLDSGTGIEKKNLANIFERFYQVDKSLSRNTEGSGIGLSLVKSIVELHGGQITADSWVGEGSVFKIDLPVRTVKEKEVKGKASSSDKRIEMINIEFSDIYSI
ncbi:MAG: ATP-binding protein [Solirubrobacterales bacterium]